MKKIVVLMAVSMVAAVGKPPCFSTDDFFKKFPEYDYSINPNDPAQRKMLDKRFAEYTGPHWGQNCLGGVHPGSHVPLGVADTSVHVGCGYGKSAKKYRFKVVVRQDNPCFVVTTKQHYPVTVRKIDSHTVELTSNRDEWCDIHLFGYGRRGLDYLYHPLEPGSVVNILGNNPQCLKQSNNETWEIYVKQKDGSWKLWKTERFFYDATHPLLLKLGIDPTK